MSRTLHPCRTISTRPPRVKCYRTPYREMLTTPLSPAAKLIATVACGLAGGSARHP